jgi:outer membrane protein assembly factor BamD (BamD/ComL family)
MGTQRRKPRQHLYLSVAGLILCLLTACAPMRMWFSDGYQCDHLRSVESAISRGDFEAALKENQEILAQSPKSPPGDAALMNLGLINAHYANPKKDYNKALGYFMRLEKDFPRSPLAEEAKIWSGVLQAFEKAKQVDLEIQKKKKGLGM